MAGQKGARERVSKTKKKAAKRAAKKAVGVCLSCGFPLRRKDPKCKGCGRVSPLFQGKAAGPYLVKGGNVVPIAAGRWRCWGGHANKASARHCTSCGEHRGVTPAQHIARVTKAARPGGTSLLGAEFARTNDPGRREELYPAIVKAEGGRDAAVARALGGWDSVRWLAVNSPDPGERLSCQNLLDNGTYGTDGVA
jgi:hypothetical protein